MPLPLRIFEDRYLIMLSRILQNTRSEFGVVLIERGSETGGRESRFGIGTVARIVDLKGGDGSIGVMARGGRRFTVSQWLDDDPFPRAIVEFVDDLQWEPELTPLLERAEHTVRRSLAVASEFVDELWPSDIELSDEPHERAWQLAGIAPISDLDHVGLLGSANFHVLLDSVIDQTLAVEHTRGWSDF
jgi:Lon protease-like protein